MRTAQAYTESVLSSLAIEAPDYLAGRNIVAGDIDLSHGEFRTDIPEGLLTPAAVAGDAHVFRYQDPRGLGRLRGIYPETAGAHHLGADAVLVTAGAKHALWLAFALAVRSGTTVLLPEPGWAPYRVWARTLGARTLTYDPVGMGGSAIAELLTRDVGVVVLNSPNNPTGAELDQEALDLIVERAARVGATVISDEVYREFAVTRATLLTHVWRDDVCVLVADSISKWTAAAGLRIGFLVGRPRHIAQALALRSTIDSCPPGLTQGVACSLLGEGAAGFRSTLRDRATHATRRLRRLLESHNVEVVSSGAIYVWARASDGGHRLRLPGAVLSGAPGGGFGAPGFVRLCPLINDPVAEQTLESLGGVGG